MRKKNKAVLEAEEQLASGRSLEELKRARENLKAALPGYPLLELLDAKIARTQPADRPRLSPWAA